MGWPGPCSTAREQLTGKGCYAMNEWLIIISAVAVCVCVALSGFAALRLSRVSPAPPIGEIGQLLRDEVDRIRECGQDGARALRIEVADGLRGHQDSTVKAFRELGD